jgi:hypothetical protein
MHRISPDNYRGHYIWFTACNCVIGSISRLSSAVAGTETGGVCEQRSLRHYATDGEDDA